MINGRDDVEVIGPVSRRVATGEDFGSVILENAVKLVEDFGRDEFS